MRRIREMLPLVVALVLVVGVDVCVRILAVRACGGEYVYPIDDTYIHMAMARTLSEHGTWGVEAGRLAFCSSSPLWTLVLAGTFGLLGVVEWLPWALSLVFNVASVVVVDRMLRRQSTGGWMRLCGVLAVAVAGPFLCTTALGMEHAMHGFFVLLTLALAEKFQKGNGRTAVLTCLSAAAATATRYESLFVLLPLGVGLCGLEVWRCVRSRVRPLPWRGFVLLVASALPVFAYGAWAVSQGGHFLPNSLLLKGNFMSASDVFRQLFALLGAVRPGCGFLYLLGMSLAVVAALPQTRAYWRVAALSLGVAVVGQMLFADVGQLCRYEAYLASAGAFAVVAALACGDGWRKFPTAYATFAVLGLTGGSFLLRAAEAFPAAVRASSDICCQQVLMTRMMAELPDEDRGCVALNDLGYMVLHGGFPVLDMWGLGSQDMTERILEHPGRWERSDVVQLFKEHDVRYVVAFDSWFPRRMMPDGTIDVATMTLEGNRICGSDEVVFRATSEAAADALARHLSKYEDKLPTRVRLCLQFSPR